MGRIEDERQRALEALGKQEYKRAREICLAAFKESQGSTDTREKKERMELLLTLSDVCKHQGALFDNITYLGHLMDDARSIDDQETLAIAMTRAGFVYNKMGKRDKAWEMFSRAEDIVKNYENPIRLGYVLAGKANIYWRRGDNPLAIETAERVLEIGLIKDEYSLAGGAANIISTAWFELADFEKALKAASLSVEIYRNSKDKFNLSRSYNNEGEIYKRMRRFDDAIASYENGLDLLKGTEKGAGYLYTNMAEALARKGDVEKAEASLEKAKKILVESEDKYAVGCMWFVRGMLANANGKPEKAIEWIRKAERRMENLGNVYDLGVFRYELAQIYLKSGRVDLAVMTINKAIDNLTKAGSKDLVEGVKGIVKG